MMRSCRVLFLTLIFLLGLSSQAGAASYALIVQTQPTVNIDVVAAALGGTLADSIPSANTHLLVVSSLPLPARASLLGIQWMELNKTVTLSRFGQRKLLSAHGTVPADWYKLQPALQLISAGSAAPFSTGRGVVVADINAQVDYGHPALAGHLTSGYDFIASNPNVPALLDQSDIGFLDQSDMGFLDQSDPAYLDGLNPAYSHGSVSAGIIAAIAPDSLIMPLRAFGDDGRSDLFSLAKAIRYAVDHGAEVINMNFGVVNPSFALRGAVDFARASNVLLVAPAGNDNSSQPQYPAAFPGVIAAAATDLSDTKALFSNYGSYVFAAAPGVDIISVYPHGYYSLTSGTSLSSAVLAGTAVLIRSLRANGVADFIAQNAVNIDSRNPNYINQLGHGRIDVLRSLSPSATPAITTVNPATGKQGLTLQITVTGRFTHFAQGTTHLNIGAGVTITNVVVASSTSLRAQLSIAANTAAGTRTVTATTGAESVALSDAFTITPGVARLTLVDPSNAKQNDSVTVNITGQFTNFAQGTTQISLGDGITINSIGVSSSTTLTVQASVLPVATVGVRTVTVTTGGEVATLTNAFTVKAGTAVLTGIIPNTAKQGDNVTIAVTGQFTHFVQGTTAVSLGDGITINSISVSGPTALFVQASLSAAAAVGSRAVTVTTGSEIVTQSNAFTVTPGTPALTGITPNTAKQGDNVTIAVTGQFTHFVQGTTAVSLGDGITVNSMSVSDPAALFVQASLSPAAAVGNRAVTVTAGSEVVTLSNAFTLTPGTPKFAISPNSAKQGDVVTIAIAGQFTHFAQGATQVSLGDRITINSISVLSPTAVFVQGAISPTAAPGSSTMTVTTGSEAVTLSNAFTVTPGTPVLAGIGPNGAIQGDVVTIAIAGQFTHFVQGATQVDFGSGFTVGALTVSSNTSLTAQVAVSTVTGIGPYGVTVTTGTEAVALNGAFTVASGIPVIPPTVPVITASAPNNGKQGDVLTVALSGQYTNFLQGATVVDFGDGIMVDGAVTVVDSGNLLIHLVIADSASIESRNVTVTTGSEVVVLNGGFSVTAPPPILPVISSLDPLVGLQGASGSITVLGNFTHFAQDVTQVNLGDGITVDSVAVVNATSLVVKVTIAADAAPGPRTLAITTGAEVVTLNGAFTVAAPLGL